MTFSGINDFYNKIKGKKIAFIGIGVSHEELIKRCAQSGALVTLCDKRKAEDIPQFKELSNLGVKFNTGENYLLNIDAEIIFRTPGMYYNNPALTEYRKKGVVVTSEMELFFDLCPCKIYAITGSDGKTTTSNLIARMLERSGKRVHLGGNLGRALLPVCDEISPDDVAVVELSSFQLISMRQSGDVSVITNVAPNHLDVHSDMQEYINAKKNIYMHQNGFSRLILNLDNEITYEMRNDARGEVSFFSYSNQNAFHSLEDIRGAFLDKDGYLCLKDKNGIRKLFHKSDIKIPGEHNVENYLTAISAVGSEVSTEDIHYIAKNFGGVEHRIELVRTLNGVRYYNDSIASSPTRTIAGLNSFKDKLILIAGGYDKNIPYAPLAPKIKEKVKLLILMGATADKIENALKEDTSSLDLPEIIRAVDMDEAVNICYKRATQNDVVLMSPASASFDMYRNFEARGKHFKDLVKAL